MTATLHQLPEVVPEGWRPSFFAGEWVRVVPPEDVPILVGQDRVALTVRLVPIEGYPGVQRHGGGPILVDFPHVAGNTNSLREACAAAERAFCNARVRT